MSVGPWVNEAAGERPRRLLLLLAFVAALVVAVVLMLLAASALADGSIVAGPPDQYITKDVTIDQGTAVTFNNNDVDAHDVTAEGKGADDKPLFQSELIDGGKSSPVKGTEFLATGDYPFICSVHTFMHGTLHVSAQGTPKPRPGGGGAGDTTPPEVSLAVTSKKLSDLAKRGVLHVEVTAEKDAKVKVSSRVKVGSKTVALGSRSLSFGAAGSKEITLKVGAKAKSALRHAKSAKVTVTAHATDAAGNKGSVSESATLR